MTDTNETIYPWGWACGSPHAKDSIVIVSGQHGDEYAGQSAGVAACRWVARSTKGQGTKLRNAAGELEHFAPLDLERVRVLMAPGLNQDGLSKGSRYHGAPWANGRGHAVGARHGVVDLNRCWPISHVVVEPVWSEIERLPGRVWVLDIHATWRDRDGDLIADSHLYATEEFHALADVMGARLGLPSVRPRLEPEQYATTLTGAAEAAGHYAIALEVGEHEPRAGLVGVRTASAMASIVLAYQEAAGISLDILRTAPA